MKRLNIQAGSTFAETKLTYIKDVGYKNKRRTVLVKCGYCDAEKVMVLETIRGGRTKSCGCYNKTKNVTHGATRGGIQNRIYKVAAGITERTFKHPHKRYGKRGIECRFSGIGELYEYLLTLPNYGPDKWIDRIDNNGHYEAGNLRWVTPKENARNRGNNVWVEYRGEKITTAELCERHKILRQVFDKRIKLGWSVADAVEKPIINSYKRKHAG